MFTRRTGMTFAALALVSLALIVWPAGQPSAVAAQKATKDTRLKELLKERLDTLKEIAAQTEKGFKGGQVPMGRVLEANQAVLRAELELCESDRDRVAVLEKIVKAAREREEFVAKQASSAVPARDVLKAKADRLEAEIALERAKQK